MKSVKHTVFGPFVARDLGNGFWQLTAGAPAASEIYVQITGPGAAGALKDMSVSRLDLEWRDGVTLALTGTNGIGYLKAKTAIVHEPKERLYDSLPLAGFDLKAKRFWRRAFILMRFPGGRLLLGIIARRNR